MIAIIKFNALRKRFQMSKENLNIDRINELPEKRKNMEPMKRLKNRLN